MSWGCTLSGQGQFAPGHVRICSGRGASENRVLHSRTSSLRSFNGIPCGEGPCRRGLEWKRRETLSQGMYPPKGVGAFMKLPFT